MTNIFVTKFADFKENFKRTELFQMLSVFQCKAVAVVDSGYKTNTCCLLYREPVTMVTGTGTGNQTLYFKPGTKLEPLDPNTGETTGKLHLSIDAAYMTDDRLR